MTDKKNIDAQLDQLLKGVRIPARPALLAELDKELRQPYPDLKKVSALVSKDPGIAAALLKVLNSPMFALRSKVGSILQAAQMLGASNVKSIVTGLLLRNSVSAALPGLESFWASAERVASINAYLCSVTGKPCKEDAYSLGLFRNCGMLLLLQRFPEYRETMKLASQGERSLPQLETLRHGTTHMVVGRVTASTWGLSDALSLAIFHHHDLILFKPDMQADPRVLQLVGINFLGEYFNNMPKSQNLLLEWEMYGELVLDFLGLHLSDLEQLESDIKNLNKQGA